MVLIVVLICFLLMLGAFCLGVRSLFKMSLMRSGPVTRERIERQYRDRPEALRLILNGMDWIEAQLCEEIRIRSRDGLALYGRLIEKEDPKGLIILAHGYHSAANYDFSGAAPFYHALGYSLLLIDERTHGQSEGKYIGFGVLERYDIALWAEAMAARFPSLDLFLSGISMGAASVLMASDLPLPKNVRGILADCGFTTPKAIFTCVLQSMGKGSLVPLLPVIDIALRLIAGYGMEEGDTRRSLRGTNLPVLLVHGTGDTFVPSRMSEENHAANPEKCRLILVEGAEHGQSYIVETERCQKELAAFLEECASKA